MCGINGFNFNDKDLLVSMNKQVSYRGPDDGGIFVNNNISLGHRRLSILDLSKSAHQPMNSSDNNLTIVFNGEIYNFKDLKQELASDYKFKTKSDTEVILASYQKWGKDCVKKFNGIFSFAIWDKNKQELFIARDQIGIKPLYYYYDNSKFIFSSEMKSILLHKIEKRLDKDALNMYFRLLYIPTPLTPWQNIFKLPPAHYLVLKNNKIEINKYWQINNFDTLHNVNNIKQEIKSTFTQAVNRQLISDRPLGLYLSGGIDSTVLLSAMSRQSTSAIKTFTVGFEVESDQFKKYNADFELAKKTSKYFKTDHNEIMLTANNVRDNFEKVVWHMDDLVVNHTQVAMYALSKLAKQRVAVVLAGDGGDELFAGYSRYYLNYMLDRFQIIPQPLRQNLASQALFSLAGKKDLYKKLNTKVGLDRWLLFMSQKEDMLQRFLRPEFNKDKITKNFLQNKFFSDSILLSINSTKALQYLDIRTWLLDDSLNRADRMSMAHGVEQRVPLLDKDMVELAMSIPSRYSIDNKEGGKKIMKEALREYIPDFIYNEPKRGFFSPVAKWLRGDLRDWAYEILSPSYNPDTQEFFDFKEINNILDKHMTGEEYALNTVWSLITFQVWYKLFK